MNLNLQLVSEQVLVKIRLISGMILDLWLVWRIEIDENVTVCSQSEKRSLESDVGCV